VTGYRSHAARRVEIIGYLERFVHLILFCVFHCWNKSVWRHNFSCYSAILLFKNCLLFEFYCWAVTTSLQSWGRFYEPPSIIDFLRYMLWTVYSNWKGLQGASFFIYLFPIWGDTCSLRMPALRPASQAGPMRNPREGTSVVLRDTIRLTWWCV